MSIDEDAAYRAVQSRDARFDGMFFIGVTSTGIYCRPSCTARTPMRRNVTFHPSSAAAQRAGFRACKRCRPDATPGSADWNVRADLAGRAVRLIADGVVDRSGVAGLATRLGYSERQVTRALVTEMGAPPLALARAQRAQTARILLERTELPASDVAFAAGFASIRQFNDTIRAVFDTTPTGLRAAATRLRPNADSAREAALIELRLAYRPPMQVRETIAFLAGRTLDGLEVIDARPDPGPSDQIGYTRTLSLPHGPALATLSAPDRAADNSSDCFVRAQLRLTDQRDLAAAVARLRRLLDLDADPVAVDDVLRRQPALAALVAARPGLRSPGAVDSFEMALRAVIGQQISVAGARTILTRLVAQYGRPAFDEDGPWRLFPTAEVIAAIDPTTLPMVRARGRTVVALATAMADGDLVLDAGSDRAEARSALLALPGIGPWTADYLLMRAINDPDVFLDSDLGIQHAVAGQAGPIDPAAARPWRSYLTHHLWATLPAAKVLDRAAGTR